MALTTDDLRRALPDLDSTVPVGALHAPVEIWRDADGIPHVEARSVHDVCVGQGFVHAQDRLWHMEYDRRRAYGRWAEYAGRAAVPQDARFRRLRLGATARTDYDSANDETRAMLDAYAAGVNAFLASTRTLPAEFRLLGARPEPWTPWDCLAVFKVRHVDMGPWQQKVWRARLLRRLGAAVAAKLCPGIPANLTLIVPPGAQFAGQPPDALGAFTAIAPLLAEAGDFEADLEGGSNNWAVSGMRTASGKPLVAGDPHRALDVPNVYYQNHLACPEFDAIGLSFPGVPGMPHFGHNRHVAWCVTHAMADCQDLFVERFDRDDPARYLFRGEWRRAGVTRETIQVRAAEPVEIDVTVTHHGPVVLGDPRGGYAVTMRYTATAEPNRTFEALLPMLRATSADELEHAMRVWVDPGNNFVFADTRGTIGYRTRGQVPLRAAANAWLPVPGWDGEYEWHGVIPFEDMPAYRNPDTGWIATANSRITGPEYPHYLGLDYAPDFRTRRVIERLRGLERATAEDMGRVHADRVSIPAGEWIGILAGIAVAEPLAQRALTELRAWDGVMDPAAVAPTIYAAFRDRLMRDLFEPLLGPLAAEAFAAVPGPGVGHIARLRSLLPEWVRRDDRTLLPRGTDWSSMLRRSLEAAAADLGGRLGPDVETWRWGRVHATQPKHPLAAIFPDNAAVLNPSSVPAGGDGDTVQASSFVPAAGFAVTSGSVARYVFDVGNWRNSAWIVPLGASGHPGSPHYADQARDWSELRLRPMRYEQADIRAGATHHQRLEPAGRS